MKLIIFSLIILSLGFSNSFAAVSDSEVSTKVTQVQAAVPSGTPIAPTTKDQKGFVGEIIANIFETSNSLTRIKSVFITALQSLGSVGNYNVPKWDGSKFVAGSMTDRSGNIGIGNTNPSQKLVVTGNSVVSGSITAATFVGNGASITSINGANITNGTITGNKISNNSINSNHIINGSITYLDIASNTINAGNIAADAIGSSELADNSVGSANLINGSITYLDIASNTITAGNIAADSIGTSELGNDAVYSANIKDGEVSTNDLKNKAITAGKIADNTITSSQIANNAVDARVLKSDAAFNMGSLTVSGNISAKDPTSAGHLATKKYVDSKIGSTATQSFTNQMSTTGGKDLNLGTNWNFCALSHYVNTNVGNIGSCTVSQNGNQWVLRTYNSNARDREENTTRSYSCTATCFEL